MVLLLFALKLNLAAHTVFLIGETHLIKVSCLSCVPVQVDPNPQPCNMRPRCMTC